MTASLIVMAFVPSKVESIYPFIYGDYENIVVRNELDRIGNLVAYNYSEGSFDDEKINTDLIEIKKYLDIGFRVFVFDSEDNFIASDGLTPQYKSRSIIEAEPDWITIVGAFINLPTDALDKYGNEDFESYAVLCVATPKAIEYYYENFVDPNTVILVFIISFFVFLLCVIATCILSGRKNQDGKITFNNLERIYNDLFTIVYGLIGLFFTLLVVDIHTLEGFSDKFSIISSSVLAVAFSSISTWFFTSISKRAKSGQLVRYTLIYKAYSIIKRMIISLFKLIFNKGIKRSIIFTGVIIAVLQFILMIIVNETHFASAVPLFLIAMITGGILIVILLVFIKGFDEIKSAISEIRNGKIPQSIKKIPTFKNEELQKVAEDLDNISDGIAEAVKIATTSERMKTELITNVSHDLKTPLTSIISYVELLGQEDLSAEAKDYVKILKQKSNRLKNIIADLFELSKSSSGNIEIEPEILGFKKLLEQTLGDMQDSISAQGREIRTAFPDDEIYIFADGGRLYRAILNVIDNALKYSLDGTRIYIKLQSKGDKAIAEISNTSAYEMRFSENEIIERFSRADSSRSSEGSGLGLSIAKTFVEINGGKFNIAIDGDMFKAIFEFDINNSNFLYD